MLLDRESLSKLLQETSKNESLFDAILSPLISSGDAPLSLFAKMVKTTLQMIKLPMPCIRILPTVVWYGIRL